MNMHPFSPRLGQLQIPWVGIFHRLGQSEINTCFIPSCLIGYLMGTRVGRKSIRSLRVYRLPTRPLQGVLRAYVIRPYIAGKREGFLG